MTESLYANITLNDVQLAALYYPILIDLAKHKHCLTYGELVDKAKELYPEKEIVQNAIAVSAGRKLDVVRLFTDERGMPDLTSLIISKTTGECGSGFTDHFDPEAARKKVFDFDWTDVSTDFDMYINSAKNQVTPRKKRKREEAKKLMSEYYSSHKNYLPANIADQRDHIIELLMEGFDSVYAYEQAVKNLV